MMFVTLSGNRPYGGGIGGGKHKTRRFPMLTYDDRS